MERKQKGFTLIELLCVIVILAVIALIASPIVINSVEQAREEAAENSGYGAVAAVKLAYLQALSEPDFNQTTYTVDFSNPNSLKLTNEIQVSISGTKPDSGKITIKEDGSVEVEDLTFDKYKCSGTDRLECSKID